MLVSNFDHFGGILKKMPLFFLFLRNTLKDLGVNNGHHVHNNLKQFRENERRGSSGEEEIKKL